MEHPAWIVRSLRTAGWAPASVFLLHGVLSGMGAYLVYGALDIPMHVAGGVVIAFFFSKCLQYATEAGLLGTPNRLALGILVFTCTCAAAVFWELAEFTYDQFLTPMDARGYYDTLLDMALGVLGGALFVAGAAVRRSYLRRDSR